MGAGSATLSGASAASAPDDSATAAPAAQEPPLDVVLGFLPVRDATRLAVVARTWALAACAHVEQTAPAFIAGGAGAKISDSKVEVNRGADGHRVALIGRWLFAYETAHVYLGKEAGGRQSFTAQPDFGVVAVEEEEGGEEEEERRRPRSESLRERSEKAERPRAKACAAQSG